MNEFYFPKNETPEALNELEVLARRYNTDKKFDYHGYTYYYHLFFRGMRQLPLTLLEIGVSEGVSMKMWRDYFPNAKIVGMDINPSCLQYREDRIDIVIGDQSDDETEVFFGTKYPEGFDIIIDDGGHMMSQQMKSLSTLFWKIKPGGFYVIEDLSTSYPASSGGMYLDCGDKTTMGMMKGIMDEINMHGTAVGNPDKCLKELEGRTNPWMEHIGFMFLFKELCILGKR